MMSLKELYNKLIEIQLTHLWNQWALLGVSGYGKKNNHIIDPEALLLYSLEIARYDARLYDEILDWCFVNGEFLSIPRIKTLLKSFPVNRQLTALSELISFKTRTLKWNKIVASEKNDIIEPLFMNITTGSPLPIIGNADQIHLQNGLNRPECRFRGYSSPFPSNETGALILKLRALFGITVRCEIIASLIDGSEKHPSQIARETDYYQKTVQDTISCMSRSAFIQMRTQGRLKKYFLDKSFISLICGNENLHYIHWSSLYKLLNTINNILLTSSDKELSSQTVLLLCKKVITERENDLHDSGFRRDLLNVDTCDTLPQLFTYLLDI
jgi:hypothetical protein